MTADRGTDKLKLGHGLSAKDTRGIVVGAKDCFCIFWWVGEILHLSWKQSTLDDFIRLRLARVVESPPFGTVALQPSRASATVTEVKASPWK